MDFALLPPEVNSTRMYSGPGPGALLTAAGSWDSLAAELSTTAETYDSVLSSLTSLHWHGPAATAMNAAATPFIGWLTTAAQQTKQTAMQARAAAAAFEQAFAMTVPPALIVANRAQLTVLIATNFFGQNTSAIAALEAEYAEMWAQDASAMSTYAASSAAAAQLTPFASPAQSTNPAGTAAQSNAVAQATSAASNPISQLINSVTQALQKLVSIPSQIVPNDFTYLDFVTTVYATVTDIQDFSAIVTGVIGAENSLGILPNLGGVAAGAAEAPAALLPSLASQVGGAGVGGLPGTLTATLAGANTIGPMSVPASWSAPSTSLVSALQPAGLTTLPGTDVPDPNAGVPGVPAMAAGAMPRASGVLPRYGTRLTVMSRPLAGG